MSGKENRVKVKLVRRPGASGAGASVLKEANVLPVQAATPSKNVLASPLKTFQPPNKIVAPASSTKTPAKVIPAPVRYVADDGSDEEENDEQDDEEDEEEEEEEENKGRKRRSDDTASGAKGGDDGFDWLRNLQSQETKARNEGTELFDTIARALPLSVTQGIARDQEEPDDEDTEPGDQEEDDGYNYAEGGYDQGAYDQEDYDEQYFGGEEQDEQDDREGEDQEQEEPEEVAELRKTAENLLGIRENTAPVVTPDKPLKTGLGVPAVPPNTPAPFVFGAKAATPASTLKATAAPSLTFGGNSYNTPAKPSATVTPASTPAANPFSKFSMTPAKTTTAATPAPVVASTVIPSSSTATTNTPASAAPAIKEAPTVSVPETVVTPVQATTEWSASTPVNDECFFSMSRNGGAAQRPPICYTRTVGPWQLFVEAIRFGEQGWGAGEDTVTFKLEKTMPGRVAVFFTEGSEQDLMFAGVTEKTPFSFAGYISDASPAVDITVARGEGRFASFLFELQLDGNSALTAN